MKKSLRALISVSEKTGVVEFARALSELGADILSTGGTAKTLREAGLAVTDVAEVTGFPEIMDGRVKTLHPLVHGGLLGRGAQDKDVMEKHGITQIDILAVNLYPFDYDSVIMLAWTNFQLNKFREAKVLFNKSLLIRPGDESALEGLGLMD